VFAAARHLLAGLLAAAFLLAGCGDGGSDTTGETTISSGAAITTVAKPPHEQKGKAKAKRRHAPGGDLCQSQLGSFVGSMDGLRRRLAVGVTYDQYVAEVRGIRSTYGEIPIEKLGIGCLSAVGEPGEKALNRYIEGANDWGECVSEAGCDTATIEPVLQRRWRVASHFLGEAQDGLRAVD
jgi:hypothetical protein